MLVIISARVWCQHYRQHIKSSLHPQIEVLIGLEEWAGWCVGEVARQRWQKASCQTLGSDCAAWLPAEFTSRLLLCTRAVLSSINNKGQTEAKTMSEWGQCNREAAAWIRNRHLVVLKTKRAQWWFVVWNKGRLRMNSCVTLGEQNKENTAARR